MTSEESEKELELRASAPAGRPATRFQSASVELHFEAMPAEVIARAHRGLRRHVGTREVADDEGAPRRELHVVRNDKVARLDERPFVDPERVSVVALPACVGFGRE